MCIRDRNAYTWSFFEYGQTTEGDVPIVNGIAVIGAIAAGLHVDTMIAVTSRGTTGRVFTEEWMRVNLPWATGGDLLVMHTERHYGFGPAPKEGRVSWGYDLPRRTDHINVTSNQGVWFLPVSGEDDLFNPVEYKRGALRWLLREYDIVMAIDDHPDIVSMYEQEGVSAVRLMLAGVDCLTHAGDSKE